MESLKRRIAAERGLSEWRVGRTERVMCGFYASNAVELIRQ
jgi:hypothetical protein